MNGRDGSGSEYTLMNNWVSSEGWKTRTITNEWQKSRWESLNSFSSSSTCCQSFFYFQQMYLLFFFASGGKWVLFFSFHLMILLDLVVFLFSSQYYFWSTVLLAAVFQVLFNDPLKMHRVAVSIKTWHLEISISQIENVLSWQKLLTLCIISPKKSYIFINVRFLSLVKHRAFMDAHFY